MQFSAAQIALMVNGKTRGTMDVHLSDTQEQIVQLARDSEFIKKYLVGKTIIREIYIPQKVVNFVIKEAES